MSTVPTVPEWVDNEIPLWSDWNERLFEPLNLLLHPPMARVQIDALQTVPDDSWEVVAWTSTTVDTESMWDPDQPNRLMPRTPGWYSGIINIAWDEGGGGWYSVGLIKNGLAIQPADDEAAMTVEVYETALFFQVEMDGVDDWLRVEVYQNTGGDRGMIELDTSLSLRWMRR